MAQAVAALSRRSFFRKAAQSAAVIAVASVPAIAAEPTKARRPDFDKDWNVHRYIAFAGPCDSFYRGERLVAYSGWYREIVGHDEVRKNAEYLAELKKRGRAHQVPASMSVSTFMDHLYKRGPFAA